MVKWITIVIIVMSLLFVNYDWIDIKEATSYYSNAMSQNYPFYGLCAFFILLMVFIFPKEIGNYWKKLKSKVRIKQSF